MIWFLFLLKVRVTSNVGGRTKDLKSQLTAYLTNVYGSSEIYNKTVYNLDEQSEVKMKFTVPAGDRDEYHSVIVRFLKYFLMHVFKKKCLLLMNNSGRLYGYYYGYRQSAQQIYWRKKFYHLKNHYREVKNL